MARVWSFVVACAWLLAVCVISSRSNWVEMPREYLQELNTIAQSYLADKIEKAHQSLLEQRVNLEIEQKKAEIWEANIMDLNAKIIQHLEQLNRAKTNILDHSKHQCINILQVQKLKCLDCVSQQCNSFAKTTCNFETEASRIHERIINMLISMFHATDETLMPQEAIKQGAEELQKSTNMLLNKLQAAKVALEKTGMVNATKMEEELLRLTDIEKLNMEFIADKIDYSQKVLDDLLEKDEVIIKALSAEGSAKQSQNSDGKSIFSIVWETTKNFFSSAACKISFGHLCSSKDDSSSSQEKQPKLADIGLTQTPDCAELAANASGCITFLPTCEADCINIGMVDICPKWLEDWKGYKQAWYVTKENLEKVIEELKVAEVELVKVLETHNHLAFSILKDYGWLIPYAKKSGGQSEETIEVTEVKYDPGSFDTQMVNRFMNASMGVKLLGQEAKEMAMDHLVDPYNTQDFARAVVEKIQETELEDNKDFLKQLIKEFSDNEN